MDSYDTSTSAGNLVVITNKEKALKSYVESYNIAGLNDKDPRIQFKEVQEPLKDLLFNKMLHKYIQTLVVTFKKENQSSDDSTAESTVFIYKTVYFNSKTKTILSGFDGSLAVGLDEANSDILNFIDIWISEGSGWTIERIEKHCIDFVKYQPIKSSSYIEIPKELKNSKKGLINLQNKDKECFRWCHIRYLNPQKKDPQRIKRSDKEFINKLDYN